jgi:hypothetical protein
MVVAQAAQLSATCQRVIIKAALNPVVVEPEG